MKSMTGFGRNTASQDGTSVTVEVVTINHKHRDFRFNLPPELMTMEAVLKPLAEASIERGILTAGVSYALNAELKRRRVQVDQHVAAHLIENLEDIARMTGIANEIRLGDLLTIPGVVTVDESAVPFELLATLAEQAMQEALRQLGRTRDAEGKHLKHDLMARVKLLEDMVAQMAEHQDEALRHHQRRLHERIRHLGIDICANDERLAKEIAFAVQKSDIAEELVRLGAHLAQMRASLELQGEAVGRHLQFLCQEVQREVNTLTAKTAETRIASIGLTFKTELDRVREQVLNVE